MKKRKQLLERKSELYDEILSLNHSIEGYTWDDSFTDAPEWLTHTRRECVREKRKKEEEIAEINKKLMDV